MFMNDGYENGYEVNELHNNLSLKNNNGFFYEFKCFYSKILSWKKKKKTVFDVYRK